MARFDNKLNTKVENIESLNTNILTSVVDLCLNKCIIQVYSPWARMVLNGAMQLPSLHPKDRD